MNAFFIAPRPTRGLCESPVADESQDVLQLQITHILQLAAGYTQDSVLQACLMNTLPLPGQDQHNESIFTIRVSPALQSAKKNTPTERAVDGGRETHS